MLKFVSNFAFCSTLGGLCFLLYSRYSSNFFWTATKEFPDWRLSNQGNVRRIHSKSWKWREIQITKKKIQLWIRMKLTKHWQFKWIFAHRIIILIHFCFKILQKLLYGSFCNIDMTIDHTTTTYTVNALGFFLCFLSPKFHQLTSLASLSYSSMSLSLSWLTFKTLQIRFAAISAWNNFYKYILLNICISKFKSQ